MNNDLIMRAFLTAFETREINGVGIIEGRPVVFNSRADLGYFDEIIESGALNNTDLTDVRLCLNHDTSFVYARSRNNNANSTMQISTDDQGLKFVAQLDIVGSPKAQDYYSAVKRGDIDKMSFMFAVRGERWDNLESEHPTRIITDISSIVEVSAVTFPAYDTTEIQARDCKSALDSARAALENAHPDTAAAVDTDELDLLKAKFAFRSKF